ncbi:hypothetical protein Pint_17963 [Pistacia integerrima]|uniref:Uncharacterized protein n=1 Tax=Pistacia integerrima TaxID=434235 RepID=A0ACC0Z085_9ROSI|nr:hypothetical protein Pint_17963 [Pistacia integerrima]
MHQVFRRSWVLLFTCSSICRYYRRGTFDKLFPMAGALVDCLILKTKPSSHVEDLNFEQLLKSTFIGVLFSFVSVYSNVFLPGWRPSIAKCDEEKIE